MGNKNEKSVKTQKSEIKVVGEDITSSVLPRLAKTYRDAVKKVIKEGNTYIIEFNDGYTAFNQKTRKCKDIPGIMWYSKISTLEKKNGYNFEQYKKFLNDNKIVWDGKNIPEFIWTKEQYEKYNVELPKFEK